jgi:VWFA-related protein
MTANKPFLVILLAAGAALAGDLVHAAGASGATPDRVYHVDVNMMVLSFSITDGQGHYITGLKPEKVRISEDGIPQEIRSLTEASTSRHMSGAERNVFILFDASNRMYETYVYQQEAVMQFIRELDPTDRIAVYKFSRNLFRLQSLSPDHEGAIRAIRSAVVGDVTALYNSLLLTLRDAAEVPGHKVVVVFSAGIDNGSIIGPDDVGRVAEDEGIPVYVVSAHTPNPIATAALRRLTRGTGGTLYQAPNWDDQNKAFRAICDEFSNSYTATYYPYNPNMGFRRISVELVGGNAGSYSVRTRPGYRPRLERPSLQQGAFLTSR